jgi:hypothetical protein|tara:strand:+ start:5020 stop:5163 length:144 start_codon:yes stop_codon:yes gene_type:complete
MKVDCRFLREFEQLRYSRWVERTLDGKSSWMGESNYPQSILLIEVLP